MPWKSGAPLAPCPGGKTPGAITAFDLQRAVAEEGLVPQRAGHIERPLIEQRATVARDAGLRKGCDFLGERDAFLARFTGPDDAVRKPEGERIGSSDRNGRSRST